MQEVITSLLALSLSAAGLYCFVKGGWRLLFYLHRPFLQAKQVQKPKENKVSAFGALCVALGGTIGVGNTIGVASAIFLGGSGAVFWMWISGLFGMALKYAEVFLSHKWREKDGRGGAHILLAKRKKRFASTLFCICTLAVSLGMGNLAQSSSASVCLSETLCVPPLICGLTLALICLLIFGGGMRRLTRFSTYLIPLTSLLFFALCCSSLVTNAEHIPAAVSSVFANVFSEKAFQGGLFGSAFSRAITAGFSRGLFSNEAGLGSAPLIHSNAENSAQSQGILGAFEVFFDTHVVCTISALCILTSPDIGTPSNDVCALFSDVFKQCFFSHGDKLFAVCLFLFAAASILAWWHYGETALRHLTNSAFWKRTYRFAFLAVIVFGATVSLESSLLFSDIANLSMTLINLYALYLFRNTLHFV